MYHARSLADNIISGDWNAVRDNLQVIEDINELDEYGFTPLIETAIMNNAKLAQLVLDHGADVNHRDVLGNTALHWAVENNNVSLVQLLLDHQADANAYTADGLPVLVKPILRQHKPLKELLSRYGADLKFAQDYINTKLIGHRYQLRGVVDIVDLRNQFLEIDLEGFFLEFTMGVLSHSLQRFRNHYAARHLRHYFDNLQLIVDALDRASELLRYQQYNMDRKRLDKRITQLLQPPLLMLPLAYQGHAISLVKYEQWLVRIDRGELSRATGDTVTVYQIGNQRMFNDELVKTLLYTKHTKPALDAHFSALKLQKLVTLPVSQQISGNCSWANIEASVPAMLFLLFTKQHNVAPNESSLRFRNAAMQFYHDWAEWDKDIALHECVQSFNYSTAASKASKAALLAAILYQRLDYANPKDLERANKILNILTIPEYQYVLQSYIKIYIKDSDTDEGQQFRHLLEILDVPH